MANREVYDLIEKAKKDFEGENYEMAIVFLDDALLLDPDVPEIYFWRGKLATVDLNDEVVETAIAEFTQAINLRPDYWEAYFERGKVHLYFNRLEEAESDFKKVIEIKPDFEEAYSYLAQIELIRGNDKKAVEYLDKVSSEKNYKYYYNLGKILYNAKNYKAAVEALSKALQENKYLVDAYYTRAKSYEELEMYKEALQDLKSAVTLMPEEKKFFNTMAMVYFKKARKLADQGEMKKAADFFIEGLKINYNLDIGKEYENVFEKAAEECIKEGNYQKAIEYLEFAERVIENEFTEGKIDYEEYYRKKADIERLTKEAVKRLPLKERIKKKLNDIYAK